jgi:hypothetical protein
LIFSSFRHYAASCLRHFFDYAIAFRAISPLIFHYYAIAAITAD